MQILFCTDLNNYTRRLYQDTPTRDSVEGAVSLHIMTQALEQAIARGDEADIASITAPPASREEFIGRAMGYIQQLDTDHRGMLAQAVYNSAQYTDAEILDGGAEFHYPFTEYNHVPSNQPRLDWLETRPDRDERLEVAKDCVTRALNEALGGDRYGEVWQALTDHMQTIQGPHTDADRGMPHYSFEQIYQSYGLNKILDTAEEFDNPLSQHIDMREVHAMLNDIFQDDPEPTTFLPATGGHIATIRDQDLLDSWNCQTIGDRAPHHENGRLIDLWIKTDSPDKLQQARQRIADYAIVRQYDEPLTNSRRLRRHQIAPPHFQKDTNP